MHYIDLSIFSEDIAFGYLLSATRFTHNYFYSQKNSLIKPLRLIRLQTVDKPLIRDSKASRKSFILTQIHLQNRDMNNFITRLEKLLRTQEKSCC